MKKHKYFIRFLVFWHVFLSGFALLLIAVRIQNGRFINDYLHYQEPHDISISTFLEGYFFNPYLVLIMTLSLISGVCLLVKKTWGRLLSITLGVVLIPFGIFLFIENFTLDPNSTTFWERIINYFQYIGAFMGYIELVSIFYGIFVIIYFTRKNVISFIRLNAKSKNKLVAQY
jgi:hypothetical protein